MPIDITVPGSPGWWLDRLSRKLADRSPRLNVLHSYYDGDPPLPHGAEGARDAYRAFQRQARTNYAEMSVETLVERMRLVGFRTAASDDANGDAKARDMYRANGLDVEAAEVHRTMAEFGDAYTIVGPPDEETGQPTITAEDPREVVTAHDPVVQRRVRAAAKLFRDPDADADRAYVYLPGSPARVFQAVRPGVTPRRRVASVRFNPQGWDWEEIVDDDGQPQGSLLPFERPPVVRFRNRRGVGEFEKHTDVLDRINFTILQRMVITIFQAFRQRAIKGDLPDTDDAGNAIDYEKLFSADPGALWRLPEAVEMWESGQADIGPIISAIRDDAKDFAAVTRTPLYYLFPDSAQGSAEGASAMREGMVFKAEDRIARAGQGWQQTVSLGFMWLGDTERASQIGIEPMWADPERRSLTERADAASKATDVTWRTKMTDIWGFSPDTVDRMEDERAGDLLLGSLTEPAPPPAPAEPVVEPTQASGGPA